MAIAYGYKGVAPTHLDWFCTDEDVPNPDEPTLSAECSRDDATADPFSFLTGRLDQAVQFLVAPNSADAPSWELDDMTRELGVALNGMATYAASAEATGATWTAFFAAPGRPTSTTAVRQFVIDQVKARVCDPALAAAIAAKPDPAARAKASANLEALRRKATETMTLFGVPVGRQFEYSL
jgi:hypothetical protein